MSKQDKLNVTSIEYIRDAFKIGYEAHEASHQEAKEIWDLYHNRHYTQEQLAILRERGQPAETFNVVKMFTRTLVGYYSTVMSTINVRAMTSQYTNTAMLLQDAVTAVLSQNNFDFEGQKLKLEALITGLLCTYTDIRETKKTDEYGRPIYQIIVEHVPALEVVLDPSSRKADYSDARWQHRFRWMTEQAVASLFGKDKLAELEAYYNHTYQADAEFPRDQEIGEYRVHDNYLIVHTITKDYEGKCWSTYWHNRTILEQVDITNKVNTWPYSITKIHDSDTSEYYGIFRDVKESQRAIDQAIIKLQLLINVQKVFVETNAVDNLATFTSAVNRVSAVIPVKSLAGIKVESLSREALDQYQVIDRALTRIQRVLGINDSFLGIAFASDSGRKVKLQQNAALASLQYLTGRLEVHYALIGHSIIKLLKQYYTAHQFLTFTEPSTGQRWIELNRPMQIYAGMQDNQPQFSTPFEQVLDPTSGEPYVNDKGEYVYAPVPEVDTEIAFADVQLDVTSSAYNDDDEKSQLMLEQVLAGATGQILMQVNPAGFFKAAGLAVKSMKTRYSPDIAEIYEQTAAMLGGDPGAQAQAQQMAMGMPGQLAQQSGPQNGASSRTLNLPQNTNEEAV